MKRFSALLISLWFGMQIGFGYIATLILFDQLDNATAGKIAGSLFHVSNGLGIFAWIIAFFNCRPQHNHWGRSGGKHTRKWIVLLLILLMINEFVMSPAIVTLRDGGEHLLVSWIGGSFGKWHGISQVIHLVEGLIGLGLVIKLLRLENH